MKRWEILFGFIIVLLGVFSTLNFEPIRSWANEQFPTEQMEKEGFVYKWKQSGSHDLQSIDVVHLDTVNGNLNIKPSAEPDNHALTWDADIQIVRGMFFGSDEKIKTFKENVGVVMEEKQGHLYVKVQQPKVKPWGVKNVVVHITANMPADSTASLNTVNGGISVDGMVAPLQMKTVNGSIKSNQCVAAIQANSVNGSITIQNAGESVQGETINGAIKVGFASPPSQACNFSTINGSVKLDFPQQTPLKIMLSTINGRLECKGTQFEGTQERRKMNGSINGGGTLLKAETLNGSISINVN